MSKEVQEMWNKFWEICGKSFSKETKEGFEKLEKVMKELAGNKEHQQRLRFLQVFDEAAMKRIKKEGLWK